MDLQPVAVVLQLVRPTRSRWGLLGDDWLARMNEGGGAFEGRPRELRTRHNMETIYCENRNGATQQTLFLGPRCLWFISQYAAVRAPGWLARPFHYNYWIGAVAFFNIGNVFFKCDDLNSGYAAISAKEMVVSKA